MISVTIGLCIHRSRHRHSKSILPRTHLAYNVRVPMYRQSSRRTLRARLTSISHLVIDSEWTVLVMDAAALVSCMRAHGRRLDELRVKRELTYTAQAVSCNGIDQYIAFIRHIHNTTLVPSSYYRKTLDPKTWSHRHSLAEPCVPSFANVLCIDRRIPCSSCHIHR